MQQHSSVTHKIHARDFFLKGLCTVVLMRWLSRQRPLPPSLTPWGWSPGSTWHKAEPTSTSCPLTLRVCHGAHTYTCMHTLACTHMNSILFEIEAVLHSWKKYAFYIHPFTISASQWYIFSSRVNTSVLWALFRLCSFCGLICCTPKPWKPLLPSAKESPNFSCKYYCYLTLSLTLAN